MVSAKEDWKMRTPKNEGRTRNTETSTIKIWLRILELEKATKVRNLILTLAGKVAN